MQKINSEGNISLQMATFENVSHRVAWMGTVPAEFCKRMRRRWRIGLPGACDHW
jgi:hypothetical protein